TERLGWRADLVKEPEAGCDPVDLELCNFQKLLARKLGMSPATEDIGDEEEKLPIVRGSVLVGRRNGAGPIRRNGAGDDADRVGHSDPKFATARRHFRRDRDYLVHRDRR